MLKYIIITSLVSISALQAMQEPGPSSLKARARIAVAKNHDGAILEFINAAAIGRSKIVKAYIKADIDINGRGWEEFTALIAAAKQGQRELVKLLIEEGADLNAQNADGKTALNYAENNGNDSIVELLISRA
jgi:uncharacterized protein